MGKPANVQFAGFFFGQDLLAGCYLIISARQIVERNINAALGVPYTTSRGPTILRVTFAISFTCRHRNYSYSMTTLRATDGC
ncbi:MAG: hypothetical protein QM796_22005 [Chthoniobacteraceae bacterium]